MDGSLDWQIYVVIQILIEGLLLSEMIVYCYLLYYSLNEIGKLILGQSERSLFT
jgi:hypothetical protein